jgi:HAD superfamily hydrolase (TIGR01509 family)
VTVRAVLFDVDGTLVDSVDAHTRAWVAALAEAGHPVEYGRVRGLIGMGGDKVLPTLIDVDKDSELGRRVAERRRDLFLKRELPMVRPTRGARDLLDALRGAPVEVGFATSAEPTELRALLEILDAADLLDDAASSEDVARSKPDPDVIHAALAKVRVAPGEAVLIGDTAYDIEGAASADLATIALRCGGWRDDDLAGAAAIFSDPADLLANVDASPLAGLVEAAGRSTASRGT